VQVFQEADFFEQTQPVARRPSVIKSINLDEAIILNDIIALHNAGRPFDLDPTYSRGSLYMSGKVPRPWLTSDILPGANLQADVTCLPLADASLDSIIFDPPFMFRPHGQLCAAEVRFTMFADWAALARTYQGALAEFARVLRPKGIVAFKCMDYTDKKSTMTHCFVHHWAIERGFYVKDLFVRYRTHGPAYDPTKTQRHARKFHCYWWVLQKKT
jgi:hypothetical protein